ncbi:hypothetical protein CLF_109404 [Clonorchis sinensis]|uniref:Uncharacterized protein n=1 Tax=Clonorchis sinensis TaxID=79923 RepID=G7YSK4_CLOSI|nr:hypothetical protein CLF_109404 [Clonorchis sinensis]
MSICTRHNIRNHNCIACICNDSADTCISLPSCSRHSTRTSHHHKVSCLLSGCLSAEECDCSQSTPIYCTGRCTVNSQCDFTYP